MGNDISKWPDQHLQDEYHRLTQQGWNRAIDIDKRRKERHEKINFDNPKFMDYLKNLEQEMKNRGLK